MQNDNLKKSGSQTFLKGAAVLSISMIIVKLCGMVYKIMLTHIYKSFGEEFATFGMGIFSNAYEIYIPLFTLATAGFPIAVSRMISESIAQKRYKDVKQIHRVSKPFFIILGLVAFALMIGISFIYVDVVNSPYSIYSLMTLAPSIFFGCLMSIYRGYFEGQRNMVPTALSEIIEACIKMLIGLSLAYIVMKVGMTQYESTKTIFGLTFSSQQEAMYTLIGFSVASAILAISLGGFVSYIALRIMYNRNKNALPKEYFENSIDARSQRETLSRLVKTAIPIGLAAIVMSISSSIDTIIIQRVLYNMALTNRDALLSQFGGNMDYAIPLNPTKHSPITIHTDLLGIFGYSLTVMQLVTAVTQVFGTSAMPSVTDAYTKGDKRELKKSIETVLKLTMLVTLPAGIAMFMIPYPIISLLYGTGYDVEIAADVLRVMGLSVIVVAVSTPICSMLQGVGRVDMPLKLYSIAMVLKLATNYVFVNIVSLNIVGGAVGSLVSFTFVCIVGMYFLIKKSKVIPDFFNTTIKPLFGALICGGTAFVSYELISNNIIGGRIATLISIGVAAVIYVISLLLMHTFNESEIKMLPKGKNLVTILAKLHLLR